MRRKEAFLGVALAALCAQSAAAQEASPPPAALEEIVVTARRATENLQDVPVAVTARSGAALERAGVTDVRSLQLVAPGLTIPSANGRSAGLNLAMRGQVQNDTTPIFDQSVALYFDGAYVPRGNGANSALFDIERVEVLKGPQGTLYGRNSTGGAIGFFSRQPTLGDFHGYVEGTLGNYNLKEAQGAVNIPLGETLAVRISGLRRDRPDSWQKVTNWGNEDIDTADVRAARINVLWRPLDNLQLNTSLYYSLDKSVPAGVVVVGVASCGGPPVINGVLVGPTAADCLVGPNGETRVGATTPGGFTRAANNIDPRHITLDQLPHNRGIETYGITQSIAADLTDHVQLKNITAYRWLDDNTSFDQENIINPATNSRTIAYHVYSRALSNELQLNGTAFDGRLKFASGVYLMQEHAYEATPSSTLGQAINQFEGKITNDSYAVYAQGTYGLTDSLRLTAGLRKTWDTRKVQQFNRNAASGCILRDINGAVLPLTACNRLIEANYDDISYNLTVDYDLSPGTLVYAAHRKGYRSGAINSRGNRIEEVEPTRPEHVKDVEAGIKSDFRLGDMPVRFNAAAYYSWYTDLQRSIPIVINPGPPPTTGTAVGNAEGAHIWGGEAELTLLPFRGAEINLAGTKTHAEYTGFDRTVVINGAPVVQSLANNKFYGTPEWTFFVGGRYGAPLALGALDVGEAAVQFDARWQDEVQFSILNSPEARQKAYWMLNARAELNNINGSGASIAFWVKNLLDKTYRQGGYSDFFYSLGFYGASYGAPRTFGVTVNYKFGGEG
jgi:iron complex outermembrane receptor protein